MINLLNAEFYKLRKSKAIYIGILTASILALLLYGSLLLVDKINQGEIGNGTAGVTVSQVGEGVDDGGAPGSMMEEIGIVGVLQQMFGGHFVGIIAAVLVSIFVIREFATGAIKNLVGKGYTRTAIFFAKMVPVVVLMLVFEAVVAIVTICMGLPFMGWEGFLATDWGDVAAYTGFQFLFGVVVAVIYMLVGELTRNLAAGISVSIGVLLFSTTLTAGLDLVFHGMGFQPSKYWVLDLMSSCPTTDFPSEFTLRGVLVSAVWFVAAAALGALHFTKADVK